VIRPQKAGSAQVATPAEAIGTFGRKFCRAPRRTGGFAPSSRFLAKEIVEQARVQQASSIIELGPGTGVLTNEILKSKSPRAPYLAIEQSWIFCSHLRSHFPGIQIVNGCAGSLYLHAHQQGVDQVGCIVSSLPWTILDEELQASILSQVYNLLQCGGYFATCVCFGPHLLRAGRSFHRKLSETFGGGECFKYSPSKRSARIYILLCAIEDGGGGTRRRPSRGGES
jgi:phosphatidylethanolamine/phosphatidyl-N-methylethanolamine N-methyltransferase